MAKWRRTAREAAKQCRRAWVPTVSEPTDTEGVAARLTGVSGALVLHEQATSRFGDFIPPATGELVVVVGPEGGITDGELALLEDATPVRLGQPVLRTSTAGAAALAALAPRLGRWN